MKNQCVKKRGAFASFVTSLMFLFSVTLSTNAAADLINSDFSSGFDSWGGEILSTAGDESGNIMASFPDNFSLSGNAATLTTTGDGQIDNWGVVLFQDVVFGAVSPGTSLMLSVDVLLSLTSGSDLGFVQLRDLDTDDVFDMTAGGVFDITSWIGLNATFEFGVIDDDFALGDFITVSNLNVFERAAEVPAPATLLLFATGLAVALRRKLK